MVAWTQVAARALSAIAACVILSWSAELPAAAETNEIDVLNKIPHTVLDKLAFDAKPDPTGAMQLNVGAWHSVAYQRIAIPLVWIGAVEGDASKIDDGWRAIDLAFAHQLADGSFETADGKPTAPTDMSFWTAALCHALLVVQDSSLGTRYAARIAALKPKIAKEIAWLEAPTNRANLLRGDYRDPSFFASNRLLIDATAYLTASRLLGDAASLAIARQFLNEAVSRQSADGTFPENGGFDSSYQCVSLLYGTYYALRDSSAPGIQNALSKGLQLEVTAIDPNTGTLDISRNTRTAGQEKVQGHVKKPDYRSVILGLYYSAAYLNDAAALDAAGRVFEKTFHVSPNG
jgi:hypothetical protein